MKNTLTNKEIEKRSDVLSDFLIKCKCGCSVLMPGYADKLICRWCGNYVFRSPEAEFKYRLQEQMHRAKRK